MQVAWGLKGDCFFFSFANTNRRANPIGVYTTNDPGIASLKGEPPHAGYPSGPQQPFISYSELALSNTVGSEFLGASNAFSYTGTTSHLQFATGSQFTSGGPGFAGPSLGVNAFSAGVIERQFDIIHDSGDPPLNANAFNFNEIASPQLAIPGLQLDEAYRDERLSTTALNDIGTAPHPQFATIPQVVQNGLSIAGPSNTNFHDISGIVSPQPAAIGFQFDAIDEAYGNEIWDAAIQKTPENQVGISNSLNFPEELLDANFFDDIASPQPFFPHSQPDAPNANAHGGQSSVGHPQPKVAQTPVNRMPVNPDNEGHEDEEIISQHLKCRNYCSGKLM